jgi:hypothetical protein
MEFSRLVTSSFVAANGREADHFPPPQDPPEERDPPLYDDPP